ncbi:hypothetical protein HW114_03475 [Serratia symbiotica]|uniref:hypothetical protein n=1 Tax=Serratia symbiotica TaxID=138074 RepID=UPI00188848F7|nr:hypothetical protein [Serratia symbiotica]MBF1994650.1 hypothetical protein [Serratia symbiotica]
MNIYSLDDSKNNERDFINHTIKLIIPEIEASGLLSPKVIKILNDAISYSIPNNGNAYDIFESLLVWIESAALKEIKFKIQRVSSVIKTNDSSDHLPDFTTLLRDVQVMSKEYSVPFNESEMNAFSTSLYLRTTGMTIQADNLLTVIVNGLVRRIYLDYFKVRFAKNISLLLLSRSSNDEDQYFEYQPKAKRGPRNKHYSEVVRIVELTLVQYPDISTYSLSNRLHVHLSKHRDAPSIQTLRRWVQDIRDENNQIPQEPYTRHFKLIHE